jgi:hypothetical protein
VDRGFDRVGVCLTLVTGFVALATLIVATG